MLIFGQNMTSTVDFGWKPTTTAIFVGIRHVGVNAPHHFSQKPPLKDFSDHSNSISLIIVDKDVHIFIQDCILAPFCLLPHHLVPIRDTVSLELGMHPRQPRTPS